ncbi:MAG: ABC transporter ATP-binding protein [Pelobium sp.]
MSEVIKVENLSKAYQLGQFSTGTIAQDLNRWWALTRGKEDPFLMIGESNDRSIKGTSDIVWSLKDINFSINQGDTVGIIGKNGAGKSTLLKLLSQVSGPTTGSIKVKGRIASLLEVGTGFHPELTGRENIFLNGAILGMRKKEILRKFEEIVDFSGVERYIDTPVKRYSSGMYVRLAFAVAAHLESEILIVDEVLAVGDAEFQKKCLGKMNDISSSDGRTILFVSHNLAAIENLCKSSILLENGQIVKTGLTKSVIDQYLFNKKSLNAGIGLSHRTDRKGNGKVQFKKIEFTDAKGSLINQLRSGEDYNLILTLEMLENINLNDLIVAIGIDNNKATRITLLSNEITNQLAVNKIKDNLITVNISIKNLPLNSGFYQFTLFAKDSFAILDWIEDATSIMIEQGDFFKTGKLIPSEQGDILVNHSYIN